MRTPLSRSLGPLALLPLLAALACGGDDPAGTPTVAEVEIVSGNAQTATVGDDIILTVRALDASGNPIEGMTVTWTVTGGGGSFAASTSSTNASGQATGTWTLGTTAGPQTARATAGSVSANFTATAEAGDAAEIVVDPDDATLTAIGATVQLSGTVTDEFGNAVGGAVTFSTEDDDVATVTAGGLVTAVANGDATVTATSGGLDEDVTVTVSQQTSTLVVSDTEVALNVGGMATLTVSGEDANGHAVEGETFSWSADPGGIVTLETRDDGAEVDVTGDAEGETTLTVSSTGTASVSEDVDVTVEASAEFEPTEDTDAEGTINATTVNIPAGVTVTATGDLTINASETVVIEGDIVGDCVEVTINGAADVTIDGTIDTHCDAAPSGAGPALNVFSGGVLSMDGAEITTSGDVLVTNDPDEIQGAGFTPVPARIAPAHEEGGHDCFFRGIIYAWNPQKAPPGVPGGDIGIICNGSAEFPGGNQIAAQDGGDGTDDLNGNNTTGTSGANGGGVRIESTTGDLYFGTETVNGADGTNIYVGAGGRGGDAEAEGVGAGGSATATAGNGGDAGAVSIGANNGTVTFDGLGSLGVLYGNGGRGGDATAVGIDGGDSPVEGGSATATAGTGGDAGDGGILVNNAVGLVNILQDGGHGGRGGHATAVGGVGGHGTAENIHGARGGDMVATAGNGGNSLGDVTPALSGGPWRAIGEGAVGDGGDGGDMIMEGGQGGDGYDGCCFPFSEGGDGGNGGDGTGSAGLGGFGATDGLDGIEDVADGTGDGGWGANGLPPGLGGFGGTPTFDGNHPDAFRDGLDGLPCTFTFIVEIVVLSDPNGHEPFIEATDVIEITVTINEDGSLEFEPTSAWGSNGWTGMLADPDGSTISFTSSGSGTVAGFPNVDHTFNGTFDFTDPCDPVLEGTLTLDSEGGELPGDGQPTTYTVTGAASGG